jgi:hypothetical protein
VRPGSNVIYAAAFIHGNCNSLFAYSGLYEKEMKINFRLQKCVV